MSNKNLSNKIVRNRPSPKNEQERIEAYKRICDLGNKHRGDISSVVTKSGEKGMVILPRKINRSGSNDRDWHIGKNYLPNSVINKELKK